MQQILPKVSTKFFYIYFFILTNNRLNTSKKVTKEGKTTKKKTNKQKETKNKKTHTYQLRGEP